MKKITFLTACCMLLPLSQKAVAQSEIYPQHFNLSEVNVTSGPLKVAQDLNFKTLLAYDVDRLLTPYVRQAGLNTGEYANWTTLHPNFDNWGSGNFRLDGHVGGHYLTALALAYAACHESETKAQLKARMDYMLKVMKDCQDVFNSNTAGLYGYIGGYPSNTLWTDMYAGNMTEFNKARGNVPLYVQHKVMAGLRDAYLYGDGETATTAKAMYLKMCDWAINLVAKFNTTTMQDILNTEHGGVNEVLADAYKITGQAKYLDAAKKYSHTTMINGMQTVSTSFLDNRHANTQVPKYIGFERVAQEDATMTNYATAARNFWTDVTSNRTVCIGGNSMNEWFMAASAANRYVNECNGPESCNSNNMLKLSESLFDATHDSKYADFYEGTMYNHILSTQDPVTGGYVYFTPLRPQAYRIYSKVNQDMWCCVGTGMENHSKYGHFIYTHDGSNTLYVNLFTPSTLENTNFALTQETNFPYEQQTKLTIDKGATYTIAIRKPSWVGEGFAISLNGTPIAVANMTVKNGYCFISNTWKKGDVITVNLPMTLRYEQCPNLKEYIAFKYGPILLGAPTTSSNPGDADYEALKHEYAEGERMGHAEDSYTTTKSLATAPLLIGDRAEVLKKITPKGDLTFTIDASREGSTWEKLTLEPYFAIHHCRVMNYWYQATQEEYDNSDWAKAEKAKEELEKRTIDFIRTGEQQSEAGVTSYSSGSTVGTFRDEVYRDAQAGGWIQYILTNHDKVKENVGLVCRFQTADAGRKATIYVEGKLIDTYTIPSSFSTQDGSGFFNKEWAIPQSILLNSNGTPKETITFRIQADQGTICPGIYYLRLTKDCKEVDKENLGTDVTSTYIKNPSFEADGNTSNVTKVPVSWALSNTSLTWYGINLKNTWDDNPTDGTHLFGVWNGSSVPVAISQSVTLPQGKYVLSVDMHASNRSNATRLGNQRVFAKDCNGYFKDQCIAGVGDDYPMQTIYVAFTVEDESETMDLGVATSDAPAETWFKIDNFRLYQNALPTGVKMVYNKVRGKNSDGAFYDLSGKRTNAKAKGIKINQGKKYAD